jgi:hypothetical protein
VNPDSLHATLLLLNCLSAMLFAPIGNCIQYRYMYTVHLLLGVQLRFLKLSIALSRCFDVTWCDGKNVLPGTGRQGLLSCGTLMDYCPTLQAALKKLNQKNSINILNTYALYYYFVALNTIHFCSIENF